MPLAAGEPGLEQEVAELIQERLQVDRVGQLGDVLGIRSKAHGTTAGGAGAVNTYGDGNRPLSSYPRWGRCSTRQIHWEGRTGYSLGRALPHGNTPRASRVPAPPLHLWCAAAP